MRGSAAFTGTVLALAVSACSAGGSTANSVSGTAACWTQSGDGQVVVSSTAGSPLCVGGGRMFLSPQVGGQYADVGTATIAHGTQVCTNPGGSLWTVYAGPGADASEATALCQWEVSIAP